MVTACLAELLNNLRLLFGISNLRYHSRYRYRWLL